MNIFCIDSSGISGILLTTIPPAFIPPGVAQLVDDIRSAIDAERFIVSNHADDRLRERLIELWQITSSFEDGILIAERPSGTPNPSVVLDQTLPDGTTVRVVWSYVVSSGIAVLVTVHFLGRRTC